MFWRKGHPKYGDISIIWWIYVMSRVFGLMPFSVDYVVKEKRSKVHVSVFDWLRFFITIFIYAYLISYSISFDIERMPTTPMEFYLSVLLLACSCILVLSSIIMDMFNRKRIWKIMINLNVFDREVNPTGFYAICFSFFNNIFIFRKIS